MPTISEIKSMSDEALISFASGQGQLTKPAHDMSDEELLRFVSDDTATPPAPPSRALQPPAPAPKSGGVALNTLKGLGVGLAESVTTELPGMVGGAMEFVGSYLPGDIVEDIGRDLKEWSEKKAKQWYGPEKKREGVERWVYEGAKMLGPSVLPAGVIGTGVRILKKVGTLVKAGKAAQKAGDMAKAKEFFNAANTAAKTANNVASGSVATLFGASQAQDTRDNALSMAAKLESEGRTQEAEEMRRKAYGAAPFATGAIEATGEYFGTKYLGKLFRLDEAGVTKRGAANLVKDFLKTLGVEVGTEIGQQAGEAAVEKETGIRPDADPLAEALDVIGPTAFMTLLTFGIAGTVNAGMRDPSDSIDLMEESDEQKPDLTEKIKRAIDEYAKQEEAKPRKRTPDTAREAAEVFFGPDAVLNEDAAESLRRRGLFVPEDVPLKSAEESAHAFETARKIENAEDLLNRLYETHPALGAKRQEEETATPPRPVLGQRQEPESEAERIDAAANEAATSPLNDRPYPTEGQQKAGNYKKGHVTVQGMDITIENPMGSERSGTDKNGKPWSVIMPNPYGYFKRTEGKDGGQIDVIIGSNPESDKAFIVDQIDPETGKFDEHKTLVGFDSEEEARQGYLENYEEGWKGLGAITEMPMDEFREWVKGGRKTAPITYKKTRGGLVPPGQEGPLETAEQATQETAEEEGAVEGAPGIATGAIEPEDIDEERTRSSLLEEAKKDKTVEGFVNRLHTMFVRKQDTMTADERALAEAFYSADKEAVWNEAHKAEKPVPPEVLKDYPDLAKQVESRGGVDITYEEFAKQYEDAFQRGDKYKPDQAGFNIYTEKMADLADKYPEYLERFERELEAKPAPQAPVAEKTKAQRPQRNKGRKQNLVTYLQSLGFIRLGEYSDRSGSSWDRAHGKRSKNRAYEMGDIKAVARKNGKIPLDRAAAILNSEGWQSPDGSEWTPDTLFEVLADGNGRKVFAPELQDDKIELQIRREENEWIARQLASLDEEAQRALEAEVEREAEAETLEEIARDQELSDEELGPISDEASDFFQEIARQRETATLEDIYAESKTGPLPKKPEKQLTPAGYEKTGYEQVTLEGEAEPIFQKKDVVERTPEHQTAMFTNILGQEVGNMGGEEAGSAVPEKRNLLHKVGTVKVDEDVRGAKDKRYKVDRHVVEYRDGEGNEYRKSFVVRRGETPNIPESGTHEELNAAREQHREPTEERQGYVISDKDTFVERKYGVDTTGHKFPAKQVTIYDNPSADVKVYKTKSGWIVYADGNSFGKERAGVGWIGFDTPEEAVESFIESKSKADLTRLTLEQELDNAEQILAKDPDNKTKQALVEQSVKKLSDFGEKIGGARKDTAERGYTVTKKVETDTETPVWRKQYIAAERIGLPGQWTIIDKKSRFGGSRQIFPSQEAAEEAIPLFAVSESHRVLERKKGEFTINKLVGKRKLFQVVQQTFPSREDGMKYMAEHAEDILNTKTTFGEEILPTPDIAERTGVERRTGDATPEMFMETFAPRGIEFGNWTNQEERQMVMNHAYDGLLDLADVLNVPPKALMLNGDLAIAFGARGQGLKGHKAHYERDYGVINLTKMHGAGHLAHEWFHALDHYLGRLDAKAESEKEKNERGDLVYPTSMPSKDYLSHGASYKSKLRQELRDAYKNLMDTMYKKAEQYVEDTKQADKFLGKAREELRKELDAIRGNLAKDLTKEYTWRKVKKGLGPASEEQLSEFDRLANILLEGGDLKAEYRDNFQGEERPVKKPQGMSRAQHAKLLAGHHTNDTLEGLSAIHKAVRNRTGFGNGKIPGPFDHVRSAMQMYGARLQMFDDARAGTEKTKKVPTSYAIEAKKMDQARTGNYWSEPHEMAARAFSSYVEDKIAEQGGKSEFLVYRANGAIILPMIDGFIARPFPEGTERIAIDKGFDDFVSVLQVKETDKGLQISEKGVEYNHENAIKEQLDIFGYPVRSAGRENIDRPGRAPSGVSYGRQPEVRSVLQGYYKGRATAKTAEDIARLGQLNLTKYPNEHLLAVVTDANGKILNILAHTQGLRDASQGNAAEIAGHALNTKGAKDIWVLHQHPGGMAKLSGHDLRFFEALVNVTDGTGITARDIIAVSHKGNFSSTTSPVQAIPQGEQGTGTIPKVAREFTTFSDTSYTIRRQSDVEQFAKEHMPEGGIIFLDGSNTPVATYKPANYSKLRGKDQKATLKDIEKRNATSMIVYEPTQAINEDNVIRFANATNLNLFDIIDVAGSSAEQVGFERKLKDMKEEKTFLSASDETAPTLTKKGVKDLRKIARTVRDIFNQSLPEELLERTSIELKPILDLKGKNLRETIKQHGGQVDLSQVLGAATVNDLNAFVELSYNHDNPTIEKTAYHEMYHIARRWLLTDSDMAAMESTFKNEETEAESFATYAMDRKALPKETIIRRAFRRIKRVLRQIRRALQGKGFKTWEDVFDKLYEGGYKGVQSMNMRPAQAGVQFRSYAPPLYSQLLETINTKLDEMPAKAQSLVKWLERQNVKPEEIKWMGVEQWISENQKDGRIDKEAFRDFLEGNRIELVEDVRGEPSEDYIDAFLEDEAGEGFTREAAREFLRNDEYSAKFHKWQLPGGEDYKELLVTLPGLSTDVIKIAREMGYEVKGSLTNPGADSFRALPAKVRKRIVDESNRRHRDAPQYRSPHWDEPNVLAHVRMNDRTDAQGNRVLFLCEVQSDWLQEAKEKGFTRKEDADRLDREREALREQFVKETDPKKKEALSNQISELYEKARLAREGRGVPPAPFLNNWHEVLMKRMLRWAAENGYDKIAWTTGEQQAERYDLSKHLDHVSVSQTGNNNYSLSAFDHNGNRVYDEENLSGDKLSDYIGKELAGRAIKDTRTGQAIQNYSGLDLKVGGEGMKSFYDEKLPNFMRKYVKQWGGKVGTSEVRTETLSDVADDVKEYDTATAHSVALTPEMKNSVLFEGQTMFAVEGEGPGIYTPITREEAERIRKMGYDKLLTRVRIGDIAEQTGETGWYMLSPGSAARQVRPYGKHSELRSKDKERYVTYPKKIHDLFKKFAIERGAGRLGVLPGTEGAIDQRTGRPSPGIREEGAGYGETMLSIEEIKPLPPATAKEAREYLKTPDKYQPSTKDPLKESEGQPGLIQRAWDEFLYQAQDRFRYLNKAQIEAERKERRELPEEQDAYLAETRYHGMAAAAIDNFEEEHVDPILTLMEEGALNIEDVGRYLHARHAEEANAYLQSKNPSKDEIETVIGNVKMELNALKDERAAIRKENAKTYPTNKRYRKTEKEIAALHAELDRLKNYRPVEDNTALSGMTNEEADEILTEISAGPKASFFRQIGEAVDAMTRSRRELLVLSGLETQETIDAWENAYAHYVPLMREGKGAGMPRRGRGYDIRGGQKMRAGSERDVVNILANLVAQHEATIVRAEKVKVGRAFLEFAKTHEGPWTIDIPDQVPVYTADGLITYRANPMGYILADNVFSVRIDGEDHHITFDEGNDHAMKIASALKNLDSSDAGAFIRGLSKVTRFLAMVNTSLNPEFIISNFARDIQTAAYNMADSEADAIRMKAIRQVGQAYRGIRKYQKGERSAEWSKWFRRFRDAGGQTGWIQSYESIGDQEKALIRKVKNMKPGAIRSVKRGLEASLDYIADVNTGVENAIRLSVFKNLIEAGVSEAKSARIAKELTVNFNRKGNLGPILNTLYLFFNASIQGSARLILAGARSRKVRKMMAATVLFATMLDIANRLLGGDDDDGEPLYDKIPEWEKERNIIIMLGESGYVKIPAPWGYNVFHVLGQTAGEMLTKDKFRATDGALKVLSAIWGSFNPMGGEASLLQVISPTVIDPLVQWSENKDWTGRKLRPQTNIYAEKPASQTYWQSVRTPSKWIANKLNELTGGDEIVPGKIDISPEAIDLVIDTFTGGTGKFVSNLISTPIKAVRGEDIETFEIPLLRRLYGRPGNQALTKEYYENMDDIRLLKRQISHYKKDREKVKSIYRENRGRIRMMEMANAVDREIKALRKQRRNIELSARSADEKKNMTEAIEKKAQRLMRGFNARYNRTVKKGHEE